LPYFYPPFLSTLVSLLLPVNLFASICYKNLSVTPIFMKLLKVLAKAGCVDILLSLSEKEEMHYQLEGKNT